ncbi:Cupin 2 conserved barrel domain protein [Methylobacterium sp. 4-46]|uniref:cupin domain-containing protein n=1 Tax=unclassified Methylobacterium TaxID=2615210 RepID=UPI000152E7A3|nr:MULTISPECIES: cupin domain-containing protein [Methylobacterium]ACA18871.1 Cupin 2 conserved barrel domain protein [Methylobacterium sp. 4-46]WFT78096.1 cupin domain-containing protein [Methylobacterium nodulans]
MMTRRGFGRLASCALCASAGFLATEVAAQTQPGVGAGIRRKLLAQTEGPAPGYVTLLMDVEIDAGTVVGRHTHPGVESTYVIEGELELPVEGQPTRLVRAGDSFQVPPHTPHAGGKASDKAVRLSVTYVLEKGKPIATPV